MLRGAAENVWEISTTNRAVAGRRTAGFRSGLWGRLRVRKDAFPFTPPEVSVGPAYRFNVYHLMRASDLDELFPLEIETV